MLKPLTYMNGSGSVLPAVVRRLRVQTDRIAVICDTLDLPPGVCRMKRKGSSAGHRGLSSVIEYLGTDNFIRFYIGVGRPAFRESVIDFVLSTPPVEEAAEIDQCVGKTVLAVEELITTDAETVLRRFNAKQ